MVWAQESRSALLDLSFYIRENNLSSLTSLCLSELQSRCCYPASKLQWKVVSMWCTDTACSKVTLRRQPVPLCMSAIWGSLGSKSWRLRSVTPAIYILKCNHVGLTQWFSCVLPTYLKITEGVCLSCRGVSNYDFEKYSRSTLELREIFWPCPFI